MEIIKKEFYNAGFRLNQKKPDVRIEKTNTGGIQIGSTVKLKKISHDEIKSILREFKILNADVLIREDITADRFIDCVIGNRIYIPALVVLNKIDTGQPLSLKSIQKHWGDENIVAISAKNGTGIEELKKILWQKLNLIRIYMKKTGREPDLKEPFVFRKGVTVKDVCHRIHKKMVEDLKFARIWGPSSKFPGQKVGLNHILKDRDIIELHK